METRKMTKVKHTVIIILLMLSAGMSSQIAADESVPSDEISVLVVGDITISSRMTALTESKGAGVFFQGTADLIQSADVATASLNASISERGEPRYGIEHPFRAAPGLGRAIANAGFDAVSLATPHIMDFGFEALADTITELEWYDVKPIGAGTSVETAKRPAWVSVKRGQTETAQVALLAYYRVNEFARYTEDPLAYAVYSEMTNAVERIRTKAALVVVWLHWGSRSGSTDAAIGRQRIFAHALINAGADMVVCQQLHTFGGIELYQDKPIVYSLSDFIYDAYDKQHSHIVIPKATFDAKTLKSIELIPILTDPPKTAVRPGKPKESRDEVTLKKHPSKNPLQVANQFPSVLTGKAAIDTLQNYQRRCAELKTEVFIEGERGWIRFSNHER
ncbi:CapA family protein [Candidatus Poribacteria bacterium]|nr:CapA family protein [Candidatus Poribacteria bacterium]MYA57634.1 CapA family protein [Candidatus Poribacteria bacterium]